MRWQVKGEGKVYSVDLIDSVCDCSHWRFRLFDKPEAGRRCKHIELAREQALQIVINEFKNKVDTNYTGEHTI